MKKILSIILIVAMVTAFGISSAGCSKKEYSATEITGVEFEDYGYGIAKNAPNKLEVLTAINKIIDELFVENQIKKHLDYHAIKEGDSSAEATVGFEVVEPAKTSKNGTLVMYTNAEFPPYEYVVGINDIRGLDVDMMKMLANELKMAFEIVNMDFNGLVEAVESFENGKTKIIAAGMTINYERKEKIDFSKPYISSKQFIVALKSKNYSSLDDLKGKTIGVQEGTTGDFLVNGEIKEGVLIDTNAKVQRFNSAALAFAALKAGRIDAVVIDEHPAKSLVK